MSGGGAILGVLISSSTVAAAPGTVGLVLGPCVPARDLVHDLVAIELGLERLRARGADVEAHVACTSEVLRIRLVPNPQALLERVVTGADAAAEGGPRLIALNIVELVQEADARRPPPAAVEAVPAAVAPAPVATTAPEGGIRARIGAAPTLRLIAGPARPAFGARVSFGLDAAREAAWPWSLQVDAGFEQSVADLEVGAAQVSTAVAACTGGARFDLGDDLAFFAALGVRGGWAWLSGRAEGSLVAGSGQGPWLGPLAALRFRYGRHAGVTLGLEGGWTTQPVFGEVPDGRQVGLRRGWLGADLAFDWSP